MELQEALGLLLPSALLLLRASALKQLQELIFASELLEQGFQAVVSFVQLEQQHLHRHHRNR